MMFGAISCDGCGMVGMFPLELKVEYRREDCSACRHTQESAYTYLFCATDCMAKWLAKCSQNGVLFVPCRSCNGSGNAFGFKENGACKNCEGQGEIEVPHSNIANEQNTAALAKMDAECKAVNDARRAERKHST